MFQNTATKSNNMSVHIKVYVMYKNVNIYQKQDINFSTSYTSVSSPSLRRLKLSLSKLSLKSLSDNLVLKYLKQSLK